VNQGRGESVSERSGGARSSELSPDAAGAGRFAPGGLRRAFALGLRGRAELPDPYRHRATRFTVWLHRGTCTPVRVWMSGSGGGAGSAAPPALVGRAGRGGCKATQRMATQRMATQGATGQPAGTVTDCPVALRRAGARRRGIEAARARRGTRSRRGRPGRPVSEGKALRRWLRAPPRSPAERGHRPGSRYRPATRPLPRDDR
jgi:hypothetical protein